MRHALSSVLWRPCLQSLHTRRYNFLIPNDAWEGRMLFILGWGYISVFISLSSAQQGCARVRQGVADLPQSVSQDLASLHSRSHCSSPGQGLLSLWPGTGWLAQSGSDMVWAFWKSSVPSVLQGQVCEQES